MDSLSLPFILFYVFSKKCFKNVGFVGNKISKPGPRGESAGASGRFPAPAGVPAPLPERGPQRSLGARRSPGSVGIPCLVLVWL